MFNKKKQVIAFKKDLEMSEGKKISQAAHASAMTDASGHEECITVQVDEETFNKLKHLEDVQTRVVADMGRTEVAPGTETVLAIYGDHTKVSNMTGDLELL